jgi:hypothetical protein
MEYTLGAVYAPNSRYGSYGYQQNLIDYSQSLMDIIGGENYYPYDTSGFQVNTQPRDQELERRQQFLSAFMADQYNATGRGDRVYLVGWTNQAPFEENLVGVNWRSVDSTIYIIELASEVVHPAANTRVTITPDQFTWTAIEREGILDAAPTNLTLYTDRVVSFKFTPVLQAELAKVSELYVILDQGDLSNRYRDVSIELWNWKSQAWEPYEINDIRTRIFNPSRFVGPANAVQVRIKRDISGSYLYVNHLGIEQRGEF